MFVKHDSIQVAVTKNTLIIMISLYFFFCLLFRAPPAHMEVPRLGFESGLQLPAYTTATATADPEPCV